ncbi:digalactosyldiacylglycerol synthase [Klebsormidium nitens]|uniref:Digalactosyldiacylglycerol synthase n=1 Tax=Klebsormidium nitens TaxID=105231 RepID=A0A0U9HI08_KLENI|nr:digalactosyldiacylglycerol synthase [Klebsormidium nitens]|eukprot:GAQ79435.1 digalactosyldiacylglycerol synthase [Klebsormidium nitens]
MHQSLEASPTNMSIRESDNTRWIEQGAEDSKWEEVKQRRRPGRATEPWQAVNTTSYLGDIHNLWLGENKETSFRPWRDPRRAVWPEDLQTLQKLLVHRRRQAFRECIRKQFQDPLPPAGVPNNWQALVANAASERCGREGGDGLAYLDQNVVTEGAVAGLEAAEKDGSSVTVVCPNQEADEPEASAASCSAELVPGRAAGSEHDVSSADVSGSADASVLYGKYIPQAAATEPYLLPEVCPSLPLQMALGNRVVTIVTTAALPWFTGTAINPLLRAAYLALNHRVLVTLMVPWLEVEDQKQVYPKGVVFTQRQEQEEHMRKWLWDRVKLPVHFRIAFYPAVFDLLKFGIFPTQKIDVTELIPLRERDVVILEEPEHLSWFNYQGKWRSKFRLSIGVGHTNYMDYLRRQAGEAFPPLIPLMWTLNVLLVRANCHKVIRLSRGVQWFFDSVVCNVHGVSPNFLDIGDRVRERALSLLEDGFSSEDEVSSARIQPQAVEGSLSIAPEERAQEGRQHERSEGNNLRERRGVIWSKGNELQLNGRPAVELVKDVSLSRWLNSSAESREEQFDEVAEAGKSGQDLQLTPSGKSEAERTPTSVLHGRVFEERGRRGEVGTASPSISGRSAGVPVSGERRSRSQFSGGCYFIGRAIWGKGYHELCQLLKKQKEELELRAGESEAGFSATKEGGQGAFRSPKHKVVQLEDLDGQALRPGGEKVDPEGGAVPLVQERGGGSTFRLLNLCMRSKFLWHLQTMWLRRRYGDRLKWLEHGRRAFCAVQGGGERAQPGNPPERGMGQRAPLERVHSETGEVNSIVGLDRAPCGGGCERSEEARGEASEEETGGPCGGKSFANGGVSERGAAGGGLADLVHVDCYGTGPHEGEIEAFAKEHALPLTFHGRIDHKELVQYKVYVNPAISDVVCTATAEALAMGKFAVIADHKSNEFFKDNFSGNCITFPSDDPDEFLRCLHFALAHEPAPLTAEQRRLLTWEAATERFMQAAGL